MREILFRGKRVDNGEWCYGHLYKNYFGDWVIVNEKSRLIVNDKAIGQYIDLMDKNGVRIFENDIVRFTCTPSWLYQVIWDKESAMFGLKCVKSPSLYNKEACGTNFYDIDSRDVEIIGNVFDNSDLLKGE